MIDIIVTEEKLSPKKTCDMVSDDSCGGIVQFIGTVRNSTKNKNVLRLEFESFIPMAEKEMRKIADEILNKWKVKNILIHHRIGSLGIGEIPVIICVAAPHRAEAFEACQYAIDTLKETVPIWKKEIFDNGEEWVSAHP